MTGRARRAAHPKAAGHHDGHCSQDGALQEPLAGAEAAVWCQQGQGLHRCFSHTTLLLCSCAALSHVLMHTEGDPASKAPEATSLCLKNSWGGEMSGRVAGMQRRRTASYCAWCTSWAMVPGTSSRQRSGAPGASASTGSSSPACPRCCSQLHLWHLMLAQLTSSHTSPLISCHHDLHAAGQHVL